MDQSTSRLALSMTQYTLHYLHCTPKLVNTAHKSHLAHIMNRMLTISMGNDFKYFCPYTLYIRHYFALIHNFALSRNFVHILLALKLTTSLLALTLTTSLHV
jgi:hypothetical protein